MTVSLLILTKLSDDTWLIKNESLRSKVSQFILRQIFKCTENAGLLLTLQFTSFIVHSWCFQMAYNANKLCLSEIIFISYNKSMNFSLLERSTNWRSLNGPLNSK